MDRPVRPRFVPTPYQDSAESGRLILRDGSTAHIRPAMPEDQPALSEFFRHLSAMSRYRRFQSFSAPGDSLVAQLSDSRDPAKAFTLVVTRIRDGAPAIVATGSYLARDAKSAEVAFAVDDSLQGKGLGTLLLERLALLAARSGFTSFWALTLSENRPMLDVFRASGFVLKEENDGGEVEVSLDVVPTAVSIAGLETRDRVATVASLAPFFRPNAVAVVGASRNTGTIGRRILDGLIHGGFKGKIYPVNPKADEIAGLKAYPSVRDIPEQVDLAVLSIPAGSSLTVVDDCASRGVKAVAMITAGFAEVGTDGVALQKAVVERVRQYGMRMVGPNCLGLLNAADDVRLNASFSPVFPPAGRIAMSSQSGAVGLAALAAAERYGLGFSTFVSVGNKADVSGNDLLQYWEEDPATDVVLLYLESFGNPRRFSRIARRVARRKPVVVLHSGLTRAGGRAAGSHTAALATNATAVEALFHQTGVVRAETLEEMFDLALMLGSQPLPDGRRVGIVTNAGGPGILCTDACEAGGLVVASPSPELKRRLEELLPGAASVGNPIDLIAAAGPEAFRRAVEAMMTSGEIDALIVSFTPVGLADPEDIRKAVAEGVTAARGNSNATMPVLACFLGQEEHRTHLELPAERIPCYPFPETPARVLGKIARYAEWRTLPTEVFPDFEDLDVSSAREVVRSALASRGTTWLTAEEVQKVFDAFRLPMAPTIVARTAEEAVQAAARVGYPVAVKLASINLVHKTEVGGVRLGLADADAVRSAFNDIRSRLEKSNQLSAMDGVVVQRMTDGGVEVMSGVTQDPLFGPLVAFGLGGVLVEVLADVSFRVAPLSDRDAADMVRGIRGAKLLAGYRGRPAADVDAIQDLLLRLSRLAEELPEIREIDMNPVFALPPGEGCRIVDARIRVRTNGAG